MSDDGAQKIAVLAAISKLTAEDAEISTLLNNATDLVVEVLRIDYCGVLELQPRHQSLLLRVGSGCDPAHINKLTFRIVNSNRIEQILCSGEPVIGCLPEHRLAQSGTDANNDNSACGMSMVILGQDRPYGILEAFSSKERSFSESDKNFFQAIANCFSAVIKNRDLRLELQGNGENIPDNSLFSRQSDTVDEILDPVRNIVANREVEEALRESQQMLQLVMDNIPQAVFWKNTELVYIGCNQNFAIDAGVSIPENIVGKTDYDLAWKTDEADFFRQVDRQVIETGTPRYHIEEPQLQADGKQAWLDTNKIPLRNAAGQIVGILGTYEDITERKQAEEALRQAKDELEQRVAERTSELSQSNELLKSEIAERERIEEALRLSQERYSLAVSAGKVCVWDWEIRTDQIYLAPDLKHILDYEASEIPNQFDEWVEIIHPDDRSAVVNTLKKYLEGHLDEYENELRMIHNDGSIHWMLSRGSVFRNEAGEPLRMTGSIMDITDLKKAEQALSRRDTILEALAYASERLLTPGDLDKVVPDVLTRLGRSVSLSRVYALKWNPQPDDELQVYEWHASNIDSRTDFLNLTSVYNPIGDENNWLTRLRAGEPIYGPIRLISEKEHPFLKSDDILSIAVIPIFSEGKWWGMLGLEDSEHERHWLAAEIEALKGAAGILGATFAQRRSQEAEHEQRVLAEALRDTSAVLNSTLDLDEVLDRILSTIGRVVSHDTAKIMLVETGDQHMVRTRGYVPKSRARGRQFSLDDLPSLRQMARTKQPVIIQDTWETQDWVKRPEETWIRSYLGAPIQMEGTVLGFINLNSAVPGFYEWRHVERLSAFADQAAIAIRNARLYSSAQELAVLEERQRIARDLHDAVVQTLWTANLVADVLPDLWASSQDEGQLSLDKLRRLTKSALIEMRMLLLELRPINLIESKLEYLLRQLAEAAMSRKKIDISVLVQGEDVLPSNIHVTIYRIAQEVLNNIAKHSYASEASVQLQFDTSQVNLRIHDNGCGFELDQVPSGCLGIKIMAERAQSIHAHLEIISDVGAGTAVSLTWPIS